MVNIDNLKTLEYHIFSKQFFLLFAVSVKVKIKKIFKDEEPIKILKILDLIINVEVYKKNI